MLGLLLCFSVILRSNPLSVIDTPSELSPRMRLSLLLLAAPVAAQLGSGVQLSNTTTAFFSLTIEQTCTNGNLSTHASWRNNTNNIDFEIAEGYFTQISGD